MICLVQEQAEVEIVLSTERKVASALEEENARLLMVQKKLEVTIE